MFYRTAPRRGSGRQRRLALGRGSGLRAGGSALLEHDVQHLLDRVDRDELELVAGLRRELLEVGLVVTRDDDPLEPGSLRREHLLLEAADRQHLARERDLTGHADV